MQDNAELKRMLGNPKSAILGMSVPLTISILIGFVQLVVDTFWCSGLGDAALSAITLSGPLIWIITDVGVGLGIGASTSISRAIGAGDHEHANSLTTQALFLGLSFSLLLTVLLLLFCEPTLNFMNDGGDTYLGMRYMLPHIFGSAIIVMYGTIVGILRSEGAGRKVLYISITNMLVNLVMDPFLIYVVDFGVMGAALATCVSYLVATAVAVFWFINGNTHLRPSFYGFRMKLNEIYDILYVGIPSMMELCVIGILTIPQNLFVYRAGGDAGMVLAMTPFRFLLIAMAPADGMASAMISVTSAALGQNDPDKAKVGFRYTIFTGFLIALVLTVVVFLFAPWITYLFTYSENMLQYHDDMTHVLRLYSIIVVFGSLSYIFSSVLQALRKAFLATFTMLFREIMFIIMFWFASGISLEAVYDAMVIGMGLGMAMMSVFAFRSIGKMDIASD